MSNHFNEHRIVIACALEEEMDKIRALFLAWLPIGEGWYAHEEYPGLILKFVCFNTTMPETTASKCTELINECKPTIVFLCGIMGGFKEKAARGDVIIANLVIGYDRGKLLDKRKERRWEIYKLNRAIWDCIPTTKVQKDGKSKYHLHVGGIISGHLVWASKIHKEVTTIRQAWPEALGVEMEAFAMCAAIDAQRTLHSPALGVVKGVSDMADPSKADDNYRPLAASRSASVLKYIIDTIYTNSRGSYPQLNIEHIFESQRNRLTRSLHHSGYFTANFSKPDTDAQKWTNADVILGICDRTRKISLTKEQIKLVVDVLAPTNIESGGYGLEQVSDYPMTVVTATIGQAMCHLACISSGSTKAKAKAAYSAILSRLETMQLPSGAWSFCQLHDPQPNDARVWDTCSAVQCFLLGIASGVCDTSKQKRIERMSEKTILWLHSMRTDDGWVNQPDCTQRKASFPLSVFTAGTIMIGSAVLKQRHLVLEEHAIKDLLHRLISNDSLPLVEALRCSDVKLIRERTSPDYGHVAEKATLLLPYSLQLLSHALVVNGYDAHLCRYAAKLAIIQFSELVDKMALYAPAQLLQGYHLWKYYLEISANAK